MCRFKPSDTQIQIFTHSPADLDLHTLTFTDLHLHTFKPADLDLHTLTSADLDLHTITPAVFILYTPTPADFWSLELQIDLSRCVNPDICTPKFSHSHICKAVFAFLLFSLQEGAVRLSGTKRNPFARNRLWMSEIQVIFFLETLA